MPKNLLKTKRSRFKYALIVAVLSLGSAVLPLLGSEHHGTVKFGGLPLPGATVTAKPTNAKEGDKTFNAISDLEGHYSFPDLPDGTWTIRVEMPLFSPLQQEVTVGAGAPAADFDLKLLPAQEISAIVTPAPPGFRSRRLRLGYVYGSDSGSRETGSQQQSSSCADEYCDGVSAHGPERGTRPECEQ